MNDVNVLLIEDSSDYVQLLQRMVAQIEEPHFSLRSASSLAEGLAAFQQSAPDLVLLDLHLGDSDGYETFARMRRVAGVVPIVVLSGLADLEMARRTVSEGAQDYLVKTHLNHHWLQRSLQYALERSHSQELLRRAHDELENRVGERTAELKTINLQLGIEVAERRKAADALRESNRQLGEAMMKLQQAQQHVIQQERLEAVSLMSSGVVHDFNNKLAPILGFSELLLTRPELLQQREKASDYLRNIFEAATQAGEIVSRLQSFHSRSKPSSDFVALDVEEVTDEAAALVQVQEQKAGRAVPEISLEIPPKLPRLHGSLMEVRDLLRRLLANAVEATRARGAISVRASAVQDGLILEVRDTGVGMSEDALRRCLEPFFSTKSDQGAGFGLSIVYGIARRHHARIDISSELGEGTAVTIKFPLGEKRSKFLDMEDTSALDTKLNILVVEDEELVAEVLTVYLEDDGHTIVTATNGREGLERFREGTFDVVLTDRSMPLMGGDQLAVEIKKLNPEMPVILLTGFGDMMNEEGELPAGVDQVVGKPFTIAALRGSLQKVLSKKA